MTTLDAVFLALAAVATVAGAWVCGWMACAVSSLEERTEELEERVGALEGTPWRGSGDPLP